MDRGEHPSTFNEFSNQPDLFKETTFNKTIHRPLVIRDAIHEYRFLDKLKRQTRTFPRCEAFR